MDRIVIKDGIESRLADSIETAVKLSDGLVIAQIIDGEEILFQLNLHAQNMELV